MNRMNQSAQIDGFESRDRARLGENRQGPGQFVSIEIQGDGVLSRKHRARSESSVAQSLRVIHEVTFGLRRVGALDLDREIIGCKVVGQQQLPLDLARIAQDESDARVAADCLHWPAADTTVDDRSQLEAMRGNRLSEAEGTIRSERGVHPLPGRIRVRIHGAQLEFDPLLGKWCFSPRVEQEAGGKQLVASNAHVPEIQGSNAIGLEDSSVRPTDDSPVHEAPVCRRFHFQPRSRAQHFVRSQADDESAVLITACGEQLPPRVGTLARRRGPDVERGKRSPGQIEHPSLDSGLESHEWELDANVVSGVSWAVEADVFELEIG
ncbi:MAG TPA: hypothetical protein VK843_01850, partial [Planctomycetota bacterium]|nr:hypothetical protein [Planctomycetota bacterium]